MCSGLNGGSFIRAFELSNYICMPPKTIISSLPKSTIFNIMTESAKIQTTIQSSLYTTTPIISKTTNIQKSLYTTIPIIKTTIIQKSLYTTIPIIIKTTNIQKLYSPIPIIKTTIPSFHNLETTIQKPLYTTILLTKTTFITSHNPTIPNAFPSIYFTTYQKEIPIRTSIINNYENIINYTIDIPLRNINITDIIDTIAIGKKYKIFGEDY